MGLELSYSQNESTMDSNPCPLAHPNHEAMQIKRRAPDGKEGMRLDGREKAEDCGCRECQH